MNQYLLILILIGIATFGSMWMPKISKKTGISYSIFYMLAGVLLYLIIPEYLPDPLPQNNKNLTLHLTELIVIISLMGAGIKIDREFSFKKWAAPLKLIGITMLLCIGATILFGYYFLGLGLASALLLGAVLAPTDPVLASDVQVGPPNESAKSATKFILTSEAGLNDGVAFPFTWLAITVGLIAMGEDASIIDWFAFDLIYRMGAGVALGYIAGKGVGYLVFGWAEKYKILNTRNSLVAISITLLVYGVTEMVQGYGFIAVFICAITLRHYEKGHKYHKEMHSFTDQIERLMVCILLMLFGGAVASGILEALTWEMAVFVMVFLLIIRPVSGLIGLSRTDLEFKQKMAISFFGIRGMGTIFYLAFAINEFNFEYQQELWAVVSFTIFCSVIVHGITATWVMKKLKQKIPQEK